MDFHKNGFYENVCLLELIFLGEDFGQHLSGWFAQLFCADQGNRVGVPFWIGLEQFLRAFVCRPTLFIQGIFGFSIGFDFVWGGAQFVQFQIVDILVCIFDEFCYMGFSYDFLGLDALV